MTHDPGADLDRQRLLDLLRERSLQRGNFVLSSGIRSSYYIDARITTMSGLGQELVGRIGLFAIDRMGWTPDIVGGLTLGADPVAYAIAHTASLSGRAIDAFTVRKQSKTHGTGKRIEGPFNAGQSVVVIEDTITTGGSALDAVAAVREGGGRIAGVLALVDRMVGGRQRIEEAGLDVAALFTVTELLGDDPAATE